MNPLVESLGPIFIVSFALQQLVELLDPILDKVIKPHKEWILSAVALVVGLLLTLGLGLRVLRPFGVARMPWLDVLLTALFVTGGTKWLNDLLKNHRLQEAGGAGKGEVGSPASRKGWMKLLKTAPRR